MRYTPHSIPSLPAFTALRAICDCADYGLQYGEAKDRERVNCTVSRAVPNSTSLITSLILSTWNQRPDPDVGDVVYVRGQPWTACKNYLC